MHIQREREREREFFVLGSYDHWRHVTEVFHFVRSFVTEKGGEGLADARGLHGRPPGVWQPLPPPKT